MRKGTATTEERLGFLISTTGLDECFLLLNTIRHIVIISFKSSTLQRDICVLNADFCIHSQLQVQKSQPKDVMYPYTCEL